MKLSIIVPVYNVEPYLPRCIDSILAQTFTDFELILVNDGSPDRCPQICDAYAAQDSRIKVIHKENGGLSDARNAGLDIACGEYIGFVDSDDWIEPTMYEKMLGHAEQKLADIVTCGINFLDQNNCSIGDWRDVKEDILSSGHAILRDLFPYQYRNILPTVNNKIYKRKIFQELRFPLGFLYEDLHIMIDTLAQTNQIVILRDNYYNYSATRPGSITNSHYSPKMFSIMVTSKKIHNYFLQNKNTIQAGYALERYANHFMRHHLSVKIKHHTYRANFNPYFKIFPYVSFFSSKSICKMKKLAFLLSFITPRTSLKLCKKYFPECIHETLQDY